MCATVIWAVGARAYTPVFRDLTAEQLGVAPERAGLPVRSARMPRDAVTFTLTARVCDCDCLVGRGDDGEVPGEITAEAWLGWLRDLPVANPAVHRLAVLRAWSPALDEPIVPVRASGVRIDDVDEWLLRGLGDGSLLTIDYPVQRGPRRGRTRVERV